MAKRGHDYWDRRLGPGKHFSASALGKLLGLSKRTIERRIAEKRLRKEPGCHGRVLRADAIEFLMREDQ